MRSFKSLKEKEILALAISLEEEDARIYDDLAESVKNDHPEQAAEFRRLRAEEDGHRHRLLDLYQQKFGDHIPLIRRQDVKGFVRRKPVWLAVRSVSTLSASGSRRWSWRPRASTKRAARQATDAGVRQLLGDLAEEERQHERHCREDGDAAGAGR